MQELIIPKMNIFTNLSCNLRCKLCTACSPYYSKPYYPTIEDLCRYTDRLFEIVDRIGKLFITGGEPLLRNDLSVFMNHIYKHNDKIDFININTNGTIIPSDDLVESIAKFGPKLKFLVDDYGPELSTNANKAAEKVKQLTNANVELRDYHSENAYFGGWLNNHGANPFRFEDQGEEYAKNNFSKCKASYSTVFADGTIYICAFYRMLIKVGGKEALPNEVFDLFDDNYTDDEIRERIYAGFSADVLSSCAYCNRFCEENVRYKAAEQLTEEELKTLRR